jgi:hypothetical protein
MDSAEPLGTPNKDTENFSLFLGGPLFQLMLRARLTDDALLMMRKRVIVITLLTWLPLLILSLLEGHAMGGVAIPFIFDAEVHVRFLVAVPLLIAAELLVQERMRPVARIFLERHLISEKDLPRYEAAIASAYRLRNSIVAEILLIAFVYIIGIMIIWRQYIAIDAATWYASPSAEGARLSVAGVWFGFVSLPIFQFLLCRWYFRIFIWTRLLWQISRIQLSLVPTHPDRVGGLGFLSMAVQGFVVLAAAHGALLASYLANRILHFGVPLSSFMFEIGAVVVFMLCFALMPLLVFSGQLAATKRAGTREYGTLAERYVRAFDTKWLRSDAPPDEALVGSADIQSLADLSSSFEVVRTMRLAPIVRDDVVRLVIVTLVPVAPLLLTMMPLDELLRRLIGVLF